MNTSHEINELSAALAKAQSEIDSAKKSAANPYFKSRYADLAEVWYAIREALSKNGLAVVQMPTAEYGDFITRKVRVENRGNYEVKEITEREASVRVVTRLTHASGQWIESELTMLPAKSDPQSIGSAITYARRYALASIAGVAQDDDDGNAASGNDTSSGKSAAAERKAASNQPKGETTKESGQQAAAKTPAGNDPGEEEKKPRMKFSEIKKLINPELRDLFQKRNTVTSMIEDYWEAFGGDQTKIIEAIKNADKEAAANAN